MDLPAWISSWLLTYLLHSSVWLGATWLLLRMRSAASPVLRERSWRMALLGSLLSPTLALAMPDAAALAAEVPRAVPLVTLPADAAWQDLGPVATQENPGLTGSLPVVVLTERVGGPIAELPSPSPEKQSFALVQDIAGWLTPLWMAAGLLGVAFLMLGHLRVRHLLHDRRALEPGPLPNALERMLRRVPGAPAVRLSVSSRIPVPVAFGWHRAEICLPARAIDGLDPAQQRSMLGHELQHLLRRDPLVLALVQMIARLLWLQPLNLVALRGLRLAAEECCDAWAARRTGDPLAMASCLGEVAAWLMPSRAPLPHACMARPGSPLGRRIHRLLDAPDATALLPEPRRGERLRSSAALLAGIALLPLTLPDLCRVCFDPLTLPTARALDDEVPRAVETREWSLDPSDLSDGDALLRASSELVAEIRELEGALQARDDRVARDAARRLAVLRVRLTRLQELLADAGPLLRDATDQPQDSI